MRKYIVVALISLFLAPPGILYATQHDLRMPQHSRDILYSEHFDRFQDVQFLQNEVLVKFRNDDAVRRITLPGNKELFAVLHEYLAREDVEYAEPNYVAHAQGVPNDPYYSYQWNLRGSEEGGIHAEQSWDLSTGGGVVVAVIDTGVAYEDYVEGWWL